MIPSTLYIQQFCLVECHKNKPLGKRYNQISQNFATQYPRGNILAKNPLSKYQIAILLDL
jgi:hypothetical protein